MEETSKVKVWNKENEKASLNNQTNENKVFGVLNMFLTFMPGLLPIMEDIHKEK